MDCNIVWPTLSLQVETNDYYVSYFETYKYILLWYTTFTRVNVFRV